MHVLSSVEDDGTAQMTVSLADEDYLFEVWVEGDYALVEYQETLTWRGQIFTDEPDEDVFKTLMTSDEMTRYLESQGADAVKRADAA